MNRSRLLFAVCAFFFTLHAESAVVTVDADNIIRGSIVNNSIPGVTLSVVGGEPSLTGDSIVTDKPGKSIGGNTDFVFGYTQTNGHWEGGYISTDAELRIDLDLSTDSFSIHFATGTGASTFMGMLRAYNSTDMLLETVITPATASINDTTWATITRATMDIAYIKATGGGGTAASIDAFQYNAVPLPASLWLFGTGLLGLIGVARRKSS